MNITTADATIIGASITAAGWTMAGRWQHRGAKASERIEEAIGDLGDRLTAHTADDARNFEELRDSLPQRKRKLFPILSLLVKLFLK